MTQSSNKVWLLEFGYSQFLNSRIVNHKTNRTNRSKIQPQDSKVKGERFNGGWSVQDLNKKRGDDRWDHRLLMGEGG
jgi:hypothetical protein